MVVRRSDMKKERREAMRGGTGAVDILHFAGGEPCKNCRLLAEVTLPPGASIGEHQHGSETEYYIIRGGRGVVVDNGVETPVAAGDVVVTGDGASHSIRNVGDAPLTMTAVIITY